MKWTRGVVCPHESPAGLTGNTNNIGTKKTVIACMGSCGLFLFPKERRRIMNDYFTANVELSTENKSEIFAFRRINI